MKHVFNTECRSFRRLKQLLLRRKGDLHRTKENVNNAWSGFLDFSHGFPHQTFGFLIPPVACKCGDKLPTHEPNEGATQNLTCSFGVMLEIKYSMQMAMVRSYRRVLSASRKRLWSYPYPTFHARMQHILPCSLLAKSAPDGISAVASNMEVWIRNEASNLGIEG